MNSNDEIIIDSKICHGKPVVRGTRMDPACTPA